MDAFIRTPVGSPPRSRSPVHARSLAAGGLALSIVYAFSLFSCSNDSFVSATIDASSDAPGGDSFHDAALTEAGCGPSEKSCIVCIPAQSAASGCNPASCETCHVGSHADAGCSGTSCVIHACEAPFLDCDRAAANGCETNPFSGDPKNCGGCGVSCGATLLCQSDGGCAASCGAGTTNCDGGCVDETTDPRNCNSCGKVCPGLGAAHMTAACATGTCSTSCGAGFADCNGDPRDGCECDVSAGGCVNGSCAVCTTFLQGGCTATPCCQYAYGSPICGGPGRQCCIDLGAHCGNDGWCCSNHCVSGTCAP